MPEESMPQDDRPDEPRGIVVPITAAADAVQLGAANEPQATAAAPAPSPEALQNWPQRGGLDDRGNTIEYIYARDPNYQVYYSRLAKPAAADAAEPAGLLARLWRRVRPARPGPKPEQAYPTEGVQAQLTADPEKRAELRAKLLPLGVERAKLQALLSGWSRRHSYDLSIATALQLALDGDGNPDATKSATQILQDAREAIVNERAIAGKGQYARFTLAMAVPVLLGLFLAEYVVFSDTDNFWMGTRAGVIGAIMSIALGLRQRTVLLDIGWAGNLWDSVLRLIIGAISGGTLVLLFSTGLLPTLTTAQGVQTPPSGIMSMQFIVLLGIMAGFAEKLVPNLLEEQSDKLRGGKPAPAPAG